MFRPDGQQPEGHEMYCFFVIATCREEQEHLVGVFLLICAMRHDTHTALDTTQHIKKHRKKSTKTDMLVSLVYLSFWKFILCP